MDYSKVFHGVQHCSLLYRAAHYGIRGQTDASIGSFLGGQSQHVVVDGAFSSHSTVNLGASQGSILGPLLFLLNINDLLDRVRSHVRLFADDFVLCLKMPHHAQIKVTYSPTHTHNQPFSIVNQATYLGVEVSSELSWSPQVNKITNRANQTLRFLRRNIYSARVDTKQAAYTSLVRPVLEYSIKVSGLGPLNHQCH